MAVLLKRTEAHASVLFFNNVVVVLGGQNAAVVLGVGPYNTCEQYNSASNTWSQFPSFSTARFGFGAAVVLNKIYIAGRSPAASLSSVEVYNGTSWSPLSLPLSLKLDITVLP
jgi:hypothetical protein